MKRAVLITPHNQTLPLAISDDWHDEVRELQQAVGGYLEVIRNHGHPNLTAFCDEEGKLRGKPLNRLATALFGQTYDPIVGNVVVMGPVDALGDTAGLTVEQTGIFLSGDPDLLNPLIESREP